MPTPNTLRLVREAWLAALNASVDLQALGIAFESAPAIIEPELDAADARGYVSIGIERDVGSGMVLEIQIITTVVAGAASAKDAQDLVDGARGAIVDAYSASEGPAGFLGGLVSASRYAGSDPLTDGSGRRIQSARHFYFLARIVNPLGNIF